jgi:hypothetical protein
MEAGPSVDRPHNLSISNRLKRQESGFNVNGGGKRRAGISDGGSNKQSRRQARATGGQRLCSRPPRSAFLGGNRGCRTGVGDPPPMHGSASATTRRCGFCSCLRTLWGFFDLHPMRDFAGAIGQSFGCVDTCGEMSERSKHSGGFLHKIHCHICRRFGVTCHVRTGRFCAHAAVPRTRLGI